MGSTHARFLVLLSTALFVSIARAQQSPAQLSGPASGPAIPPVVATVPPSLPVAGTRGLQYTELQGCNADPLLAQLEAHCHFLPVARARGTGANPADARLAADGDACTIWNSGGFAPQAIEVSFAAPQSVHGVMVVPEMTPAVGNVEGVIERVGGDGIARPVRAIRAGLATRRVYVFLLEHPVTTRTIRLRTVGSPSWVAWREVRPFACAEVPQTAPPVPPVVPLPASSFSVVPGRGACVRNADCAPDVCCGPRTCSDRAHAPRCGGVGCPAVVSPFDTPGAGCFCNAGRCASRVLPRWMPGTRAPGRGVP